MLESIFFQIFLPFFIHPGFPESGKPYNSGLEVEHSYETDKPPADYPLLIIDVMAHDNEFNILQPGIYAVDLMPNAKSLLILEGNKIIARCPIIQIIELDENQQKTTPSVEVAFIKNNKIIIIYKNKDIEAHGFLYKSGDVPD